MELLAQLWLPILLSAAAIWIASAVIWMVMPHHKNDFQKVPNEDALISALKSLNLPTGSYHFPHCGTHKESRDPEFQRKWKEGPAGMLNIMKCDGMGKNMILTFLVQLVANTCIAYLATFSLDRGIPFIDSFRFFATAGALTWCFASLPNQIWFGASRSAKIACFIDGLIYAAITGAIFAAFWPKA